MRCLAAVDQVYSIMRAQLGVGRVCVMCYGVMCHARLPYVLCVYVTLLTLGAHAQRGLQWLFCHSVCYHVFCRYAQEGGQ